MHKQVKYIWYIFGPKKPYVNKSHVYCPREVLTIWKWFSVATITLIGLEVLNQKFKEANQAPLCDKV